MKLIIEGHSKKKTRSEILKVIKLSNLNAMLIKRILYRYADT